MLYGGALGAWRQGYITGGQHSVIDAHLALGDYYARFLVVTVFSDTEGRTQDTHNGLGCLHDKRSVALVHDGKHSFPTQSYSVACNAKRRLRRESRLHAGSQCNRGTLASSSFINFFKGCIVPASNAIHVF